jgi:hypothetical protein
MKNSTIYIAVAVIIVILVVGVAGYYLLYNNNGDNTTPTPTPGPSDTIVGASTVQFTVNETSTATGDIVGYSFACKDYDTATEMVRVDMCIGDDTYSYILDAGQQTSWMSLDGGATWMESVFADDWVAYGSLFNDFAQKIIDNGSLADLTYSTDTASYTIYCIAANATIDDSMFATS